MPQKVLCNYLAARLAYLRQNSPKYFDFLSAKLGELRFWCNCWDKIELWRCKKFKYFPAKNQLGENKLCLIDKVSVIFSGIRASWRAYVPLNAIPVQNKE